MTETRVLIVDDHPLMRSAIRNAVECEPGLEVAGEAMNGQMAVELYRKLHPDITIMDLFMPVMGGIEAITEILKFDPEARIMAITSSSEDEKVVAAIRAGAKGYLLKDSTQESLLIGIKTVAAGKRYIPPEVGEKLSRALFQENLPPKQLTKREEEVLALLGEGLSNAAIAEKLYLSSSTVRVHIYNILSKLGLEDRNQAVVYATRSIKFKNL